MFKLNLVIRRKGEDVMIFSPSPLFRLMFLIIVAVMISGIAVSITDGGETGFTIQLVIAAVCIFAALYEESWTFNRAEKLIYRKTGLTFINRKKTIAFTEVENLELMAVIRGGRQVSGREYTPYTDKPENSGRRAKAVKYYQELKLNLISGMSVTIECFEGYNTDSLSRKAGILSDFCGFQLSR